jgi:hypothetical protein
MAVIAGDGVEFPWEDVTKISTARITGKIKRLIMNEGRVTVLTSSLVNIFKVLFIVSLKPDYA